MKIGLAALVAVVLLGLPTAAQARTANSQAGQVFEYRIAAFFDLPEEIISGPDGRLWVLEENSNSIVAVTTTGTVTRFVIPCRYCNPRSLIAGPDGNFWFVLNSTNQLARMTPVGKFTFFPLPQPANPTSVAVGPGLNLWVSEELAIDVLDWSGQLLARYPAVCPGKLRPGPDYNMWFAFYCGWDIGKMTADGQTTTYGTSLPIADFTFGPDGNIWATTGGTVERMTLSGTITSFPVPAGQGAYSIASGPGGRIWMTQATGLGIESIASMSLSGAFTTYVVPTPDPGLAGITAGPDGNVWFTEDQQSKVGKIAVTPPRPSITQS